MGGIFGIRVIVCVYYMRILSTSQGGPRTPVRQYGLVSEVKVKMIAAIMDITVTNSIAAETGKRGRSVRYRLFWEAAGLLFSREINQG